MSYKNITVFKGLFDIYFLLSMLIVILFTLLVDVPKLKKDGFNRDAKIAKTISIIYLIIAPTIYIIFKII